MKRIVKKVGLLLLALLLVCSFGQTVEAKSGNSTGNVMTDSYVGNPCRSGKYIYYSVYNKLYRFDTSSRKVKLVKKFKGFSLSSINVYNKKIYLTVNSYEGTGGTIDNIYRINLSGSGAKKLAKGRSCMVVDGNIYYIQTKYNPNWRSDSSVAICRMKTNGSGKKVLRKVSNASRLSVYNGRVYYYDSGNICSIKNNGSDFKTEVTGYANPLGLENGWLYFMKYVAGGANVYRKRIGSYGSEYVAGGVSGASVQGNDLYYTVRLDNNFPGKTAVYRKNVNTGNVTKVYTGKGANGVLACGNWLYINKYLGNKKKNFQVVMMTTGGKKVKGLQKCFLS